MGANEGEPGKRRVVVIDDDPMFVELISQLLKTIEGHEVVSPDSWQDGPSLVQRARPDLVILDVVLGRNDAGYAVLEQLPPDVPVIVCSAAVQSVQAHADVLRDRGAKVLLKPFDLEEMLRLVREALDSPG